jgi:chromosome segregation ATPase
MADKATIGEVEAAARELETALAGLERATAAAARIRLISQRNVGKAAQAVTDAAACQPSIAAGIQRMLAALNGARDRNARSVDELSAISERVRARGEECGALQLRFAELGEAARTTTAAIAALSGPEAAALVRADKLARINAIEQQLAALVEDAGALARSARAAEIDDIAKQAESLRQQVQAARNKVTLLQRKLEGMS